VLSGRQMVPKDEFYSVERSIPHGHVEAVLGTIEKLGVDSLLGSRPCRERELVLAMIAQRIIDPCSKLAYYVEWHMRKALAPVLFQDEELDAARWSRDPVAKAEPSQSAKRKKATRMTPDGWPAQSFEPKNGS